MLSNMAYYEHIVWDLSLWVDTTTMSVENIFYTSLDGNKIIKDGKHLFTLDIENNTIDFGENFEEVWCFFSQGRPCRPFSIKSATY